MVYLLIILAITLVVVFVKHRYNYWKVRGVPYLKPYFPAGNLWGLGTRKHLSEVLQALYKQLKGSGPFGGIYFFIAPVALALDLDFVKNVLVKDFEHFHDRAIYFNEKDDPLTAHLFTMEGSNWRNLRVKLTPTFTSGKMKMMFPIIHELSDKLVECISSETDGQNAIEVKDILARFTTDVIGNCAFGLECNSLQDPNAEFRSMGRKIFDLSPFNFIKIILAQQCRPIARALGITVLNSRVSNFFLKAVKDNVEFREKNKIERFDFMSLLIKLKNAEHLEDTDTNALGKLTLKEISAQAFIFFFAGFETSSTLMSFCLYELAMNSDLQEKARQNVEDVLHQHGSLTYEAINDMKFLSYCIQETLRKHPPASNIFRTTTRDYEVPGTKFTIEKGTSVMIPVLSIHQDPEYYPEPEKFDPYRFTPQEVAKRNPFSFIPFGDGPRVCIGMRFGLMQATVGLASLLRNFRFTMTSQTRVPIKIKPSSAILMIEGGLWLRVEKISSEQLD